MQEIKGNYKFYSILSMIYITFVLAANVLIYKIIQVGPFIMSVGSFITPFWFVTTDIIAEVYGLSLTKKLIWSGLFCSLIFSIVCVGLIHLPSPQSWHFQQDYNQVLGKLLLIFFGSLAGIFAGSFINACLLVKWKILMQGKYFWLRSIGSSGIGQLVFTIVTIIIDLMGILPLSKILELIVISYSIKIAITPAVAVLSTFITDYLKRVEKIDAYDYNVDFNPFKNSLGGE